MRTITLEFPREATTWYDRPAHSVEIVVPPSSQIATAEQMMWALLRANTENYAYPNSEVTRDAAALRAIFGKHLDGEKPTQANVTSAHDIDALLTRCCQRMWRVAV